MERSAWVAAQSVYGYDAFGNQTSITDPKGRVTKFTFDELNRQVMRELPLGVESTGDPNDFVESMQYNALGQLTRSIDFEGRVTDYVYDNTPSGGGRLQFKNYATNVNNANAQTYARTVEYTYDALGRLVETDDSVDGVTANTYDAEGRLTQVDRSDATDESILNHEYDALGRLRRTYTGAVDPTQSSIASDGKAVTDTRYAYDSLGRLQSVTVHERNDTPLTTPEETEYTYDLVGNLDTQANPNGVVVDHEYDSLNRLKMIVHFRDADSDKVLDAGESKVAQFDYTLDAAGNRIAAVEKFDADNTPGTGTDGLEKEQTFNWKYDALNRLIEESFDTTGSTDDYVAQYTFDLASNRKSKLVDKGNATPGSFAADETTTYTYDSNDRLTQEIKDSTNDNDDSNIIYGYDGTTQTSKIVREGLTPGSGTITEQHSYAYDVTGRMSQSVVTKDGVTTTSTHTYNDQGVRVQQAVTVGSTTTTTNYVIDANNHTGYTQVLEEKDANGNVTKTYTIGHDVIAQAAATAAEALRFLYDGHGSTRGLVTGTGGTAGIFNAGGSDGLQLFTYDAYGNLVGFTGTALTRLLYSGELTDATTGLQYLRARYYDAAMGRFTRLDPFAGSVNNPVSLHKYLYAHGNPVMRIDPSGRMSLGGIGTTVSVMAVITTAVLSFVGAAVKVAGVAFAAVNIGTWIQYFFVNEGSIIRRAHRATDDLLALYPWWIYPKGSSSILPHSPRGIVNEFRHVINGQQAAPPELVAAVLLTEMRHYNILDTFGDSSSGNHSIGIAQIQPEEIVRHSTIRTSIYGKVWTESDAKDALWDPTSAIQLLALEIQFFAEQARIDLSNWSSLSEAQREELVAGFANAKDVDLYEPERGWGRDWGISSYRIIRDEKLLD